MCPAPSPCLSPWRGRGERKARFRRLIQSCRLGHHLDGLRLVRSHAERIRAAVLPGAIAFADARRWANQRFQIDPLVGHSGDGFFLVAREVEFLDALGGVAEAAPDHDVVMKILGAVTMPPT